MPATSAFVYLTCQVGSEALCKKEIADSQPEWKFAFSRPGFLTFKLPENHKVSERFTLRSTFARTFGWSIGNIKYSEPNEIDDLLQTHPELAEAGHLHVWQRDKTVPGRNGFEPGQSKLAGEVGSLLAKKFSFAREPQINRRAQAEDLVLDVAMVEPDWWWFGWHYATTRPQQWPGGVPIFDFTPKISRAYYKLKEALLWAGIQIKPDDVCAEIGASPGGAVQLMLEMGGKVIAVDPAELDEELDDAEGLTYIRKRGREVRKREFRDVRWLVVDMSVAPKFALDTLEDIVSNEQVDVSGIVVTLKLPDKALAHELDQHRDRVRGWGFSMVKTRQLAFNRQELCLIGVKDKFMLRARKKRS